MSDSTVTETVLRTGRTGEEMAGAQLAAVRTFWNLPHDGGGALGTWRFLPGACGGIERESPHCCAWSFGAWLRIDLPGVSEARLHPSLAPPDPTRQSQAPPGKLRLTSSFTAPQRAAAAALNEYAQIRATSTTTFFSKPVDVFHHRLPTRSSAQHSGWRYLTPDRRVIIVGAALPGADAELRGSTARIPHVITTATAQDLLPPGRLGGDPRA